MARSATLTVMIKAVEKAARGLKRDFGEVENLQVSRKGPGDFVSVADKKAEETLHDELLKARPDFAFLMEEGGAKGDPKAENRWIIDPLDGTTNFLHGIPHWAISVAWEHKGQVIAGVVYDPLRDEMFFAEKGDGAFLNSRRLRVSARREMETALFGVSDFKTPIATKQRGIRRLGSIALDLAYVAAGRYEGYWGNAVNPWDVAAGALIVSEAGGHVTRLDGRKYTLGSPDLLATNDEMHTTLVKMLRPDDTTKTAAQKAAR